MNAMIQSMRNFGSTRMVVLSVVGIALIFALVLLSLKLASPVMSPLYNNLSAEDSAVIATELGSMGIDFKVASGGSEVLVQSSEVLKVRMALAQKGLPNKGSIVGYEIFDRDSPMGTSSFVNDVNMVRALEGELSRTIGSLASIKSARIHLVMPKHELFQKGKVEPSASVVLTLRNHIKIPKNETLAVKHLVASSVPGLKVSRVTVIDSTGEVLAKGAGLEDEGESSVSASNSEEYRVNYENKTKKTVEDLLEEAVGVGKVEAQVTAEMGFDRIVTNSETYDPDGQVARSIQTSESNEKSADGAGGAVSVANNLPNAGAAGAAGGAANTAVKTDEVTNFEISKTVTNKISEVGVIKKVSIAVLVDGRYETDEEGNKTYKPRSEEELERYKTLVKSAIGFDQKRGDIVEVVNMQFSRDTDQFLAEEGPFDWLKREFQSLVKFLIACLLLLLTLLLVVRPLVNNAFKISAADIAEEEAAAKVQAAAGEQLAAMGGGPGGGVMPGISGGIQGGPMGEEIDLDMIQGRMDTSPAKKINDLIGNNPEETLAVIRTWLSQKA